ncbi:transmembrane protein 62-like [Pelomyxa schiedti]|nr:transmembrane protein 62-like [Pelomyxa schiedti]
MADAGPSSCGVVDRRGGGGFHDDDAAAAADDPAGAGAPAAAATRQDAAATRLLQRDCCAAMHLGACVAVFALCILVLSFGQGGALPGTRVAGREGSGGGGGDWGGGDGVMWFVHVTDLHISMFEPAPAENFNVFCNETLRVINPGFIVVTGDLCDSWAEESGFHTQQHKEEWELYRSILDKNGIPTNFTYWDTLGNHDVFGVLGPKDDNLYARQYSVAGALIENDVFEHVYRTSFGSYRIVFFIGLWGGAGLSLSIDGPITRESVETLKNILANDTDPTTGLKEEAHHFPITAWLVGHIHSTGYDAHYNRLSLELSLADFQEQTAYRVIGLDHDMFSFQEGFLDEWPLILVTNPKDALFLSQRDPISVMRVSTHIHCLVFAPFPVSVSVSIDGVELCHVMDRVGSSSLYTCPWSPTLYTNLHKITVTAWFNTTDGGQSNAIHEHFFSVDGTTDELLSPTKSFILGVNIVSFFYALYIIVMVYILIFMLVLPPIFATLYRMWAGSRRRGLKKMDPVLGPVSIAWMTSIEEKAATFNTYTSTMHLSTLETFTALATWRLRSTLWRLSHIPLKYRLFLMACGLISSVGPTFFGPFGDYWGASFFWGTAAPVVGVTPFMIGYLEGAAFLLCIFYPSIAIINERTRPRQTLPKPGITVWEWVMLILQFVVLVAACIAVILLYSVWCMFLSPGLLWCGLVLLLVNVRLVLLAYATPIDEGPTGFSKWVHIVCCTRRSHKGPCFPAVLRYLEEHHPSLQDD